MVALIKLFGIVIVIMGVAFMLRPELLKQYLLFWTQNKKLYLGAIISAVAGAVLLSGAPQCRIAWIVTVAGIWGILKGVLILILGKEKMISTIKWWHKRPAKTVRAMATGAVAIGSLIIFAA